MNLLKKKYVVRRITQGGIQSSNGYYGASKEDLIFCLNVQPYKARFSDQTNVGPEGQTGVRRIQSWGSDAVRPVDQYNDTLADRLCYKGIWYMCETAEDWEASLPIDHCHAIWVEMPRTKQEPPVTVEEVAT